MKVKRANKKRENFQYIYLKGNIKSPKVGDLLVNALVPGMITNIEIVSVIHTIPADTNKSVGVIVNVTAKDVTDYIIALNSNLTKKSIQGIEKNTIISKRIDEIPEKVKITNIWISVKCKQVVTK